MLNDQQAHSYLHAAGDEIVVTGVDPTAVIAGSRRGRHRRLLAVVGVAAAVGLIIVGGVALGLDRKTSSPPAAGAPSSSGTQQSPDAATRHRLWQVAQRTAVGMDGRIEVAEAVKSQHVKAVRLTSGDRVMDNQAVWVIQVEGVRPFVCNRCSGPLGAEAPTGRFLTIVLDAKTWQSTDFGIGGKEVDLSRLGRVFTLRP